MREYKLEDLKKIYRKKALVLFGIAFLGVAALFFVLQPVLRSYARQKQEQNNNRFFSSTRSNLSSNEKELQNLTKIFHENNTIMLNDLVKAYSDNNYRELAEMPADVQSEMLYSISDRIMDCVWLMITNRDGDILVSNDPRNNGMNFFMGDEDEMPDFTLEEYQELCDGKKEYLSIDNPYLEESPDEGKEIYIYSQSIPGTVENDGSKYMVLAFSSDILDTAKQTMSDLSSWLNGSTIGNNGAVFMVDAAKDQILYDGSVTEENLTGKKASESGLGPDILTGESSTGITEIAGVKYYVSARSYVSELYGINSYLVAAIPVKDLYGVNSSVVIWNICLFLVLVIIVIVYSSFVRYEVFKSKETERKIRLFKRGDREYFFSLTLAGKILPIVLTAALLILFLSFYYQALMHLSDCFSEAVAIGQDVSRNIEESSAVRDYYQDYYTMQYENRSKFMAFIVALNGDEYLNYSKGSGDLVMAGNIDGKGGREEIKDEYDNTVYVIKKSAELEELRRINTVQDIYLISDRGITMATSSDYWNYSLGTDADDPSSEFRDILYGKQDTIFQDVVLNGEGIPSQYVGTALQYYTCLDEDGNTRYVGYADYLAQQNGAWEGNEITAHRGVLQLELILADGEQISNSAKPEYILSNTKLSNDGFLTGFQYNAEADDYVVFYSQKPGLIGQNATDLGISSRAFTGNYNGFGKFDSGTYLQSFRSAGDYFISTAMSVKVLYGDSLELAVCTALLALGIMLILSAFMIFTSNIGEEKLYREETDPLEIFFHRKREGKWKKSTANHKFETIIKNSGILLGIIFLVTFIYEANRFGSNSAIAYILSGDWDRGMHIFSISACFVILIVTAILLKIFEHVACLIAETFGNRMITLIQLFISLIKAAAIVFVVMYCLYLMGRDAKQLLASAGVLSVVVGLGAQSLVGDLLAGIFIIMEGSLHVGDYVLINGVRGRVMEIGLRITRYEDDNQNIRVICNNELKAFANMSVKYSVVYYNIPVPYNEDYPRIQRILNEEFLKLYEEKGFLKGIPACQGIENFSESSVDLRVRFVCEEQDRFMVQRYMHDQIMRIFMENGITIPFNQLDIHIERELLSDPDGQGAG